MRRPLSVMKKEERRAQFFVRNAEAGNLLEMFLVSAVASVLVIRFFLQAAGYPQIGGGMFHIAHILWGGLFMMVAFVIALAFLGSSSQRLAAIGGGIGFGAFLDELGKFITSDHNYFFQPTIALIYVIFVLMYLAFRWLGSYQKLTRQESLVNALAIVQEAALHRMDEAEKIRLGQLLSRADAANPVARLLKSALEEISVAPQKESLYEKIRRFVWNLTMRFVRNRWFSGAVITVFIVNSLVAIFQTLGAVWPSGFVPLETRILTLSPLESGELLFSALSGIFVVIGVVKMRISRLSAYHFFRYGVLISIFLTNFFLFFQEELGALAGLAGNIALLGILNYLIKQEKGEFQNI